MQVVGRTYIGCASPSSCGLVHILKEGALSGGSGCRTTGMSASQDTANGDTRDSPSCGPHPSPLTPRPPRPERAGAGCRTRRTTRCGSASAASARAQHHLTVRLRPGPSCSIRSAPPAEPPPPAGRRWATGAARRRRRAQNQTLLSNVDSEMENACAAEMTAGLKSMM